MIDNLIFHLKKIWINLELSFKILKFIIFRVFLEFYEFFMNLIQFILN